MAKKPEKKKRVVIFLCTGNLTRPFPQPGSGLYSLGWMLNRKYDCKANVTVINLVHDINAECAVYLLQEIKQWADGDEVVYVWVGHSHGIGEALPTFNAQMIVAKLTWELIVAIDPVPFPAFPPFFKDTSKRYVLPANVRNAVGICTTTHPGLHMPYGLPIRRATETTPTNVRQVTFDRETKEYDAPFETWIPDPKGEVQHPNIDNDSRTWAHVLKPVEAVIAGEPPL